MPNIQAITRDRHQHQRWSRYTSYRFAASDAVAALVAQELPAAMLSLPIAFFAADGGSFLPVAVQGLQPGQNLWVARDGRWLAGYVPCFYRTYPFVLANVGTIGATEGADASPVKQALCIDEDCGLVAAASADASGVNAIGLTEGRNLTEAFFADDGEPSPAVAEALILLNQIASNRVVTQRICAVLQKHALIQPWPITLQGEAGEQNIEGLFRIDEVALNQLPADAFMELRTAGALPVAYCQMLSMQNLPKLAQLAQAHATAAAAESAAATAAAAAQSAQAANPLLPLSGELNLDFMNKGGTLSFGNLFK